jgi:hypothetical protein
VVALAFRHQLDVTKLEEAAVGWIIEREGLYDEHEGHAAFVTADGRLTGTSTGAGVLIRRPDASARSAAAWAAGRTPATEDMDELVPWDDVVGWQTVCACGWTGKRWDRSATLPGEYGGRHPEDAYLADGETVEARAQQDWAAHIEPLEQLGAVREARQRLDEAVCNARAAGASWADIGVAAEMSEQAAREGWDHR